MTEQVMFCDLGDQKIPQKFIMDLFCNDVKK